MMIRYWLHPSTSRCVVDVVVASLFFWSYHFHHLDLGVFLFLIQLFHLSHSKPPGHNGKVMQSIFIWNTIHHLIPWILANLPTNKSFASLCSSVYCNALFSDSMLGLSLLLDTCCRHTSQGVGFQSSSGHSHLYLIKSLPLFHVCGTCRRLAT